MYEKCIELFDKDHNYIELVRGGDVACKETVVIVKLYFRL